MGPNWVAIRRGWLLPAIVREEIISAVMALMARDESGPDLALQLLIYPATAPRPDSASHRELPDAPILDKPVIEYFYRNYVGDNPPVDDYRFAPAVATDHGNLPPAEIIVAGFDPLREEGLAYGDILRAAGSQANVTNYGGMFHAFIQMPGVIGVADQAIDHCVAALRRAFKSR